MSDFLPEEVVINILARLPVKSLLRFRCVSKSWKSLISCPNFVSMHIHHSYLSKTPTPSPRILLRHYSRDKKVEVYSVHRNNETFDVEEDIKISFPFRGLASSYFRIVGFCNGLLCLSDDMFGYSNLIMLWNPLVRKKLTLPLPRSRLENLGPYMFILGFGYDVKSKDFKVVRVAYVQGDHGYNLPPIVEIFSLKTGNWREMSTDHLPQSFVIEHFWSQAFVHGKVHWVAYKQRAVSTNENLIMAFDLGSEVFEEIPLPNPLINESPVNINSVVYEEKLAVIHYNGRVGTDKCSIWVMEEYGSRKSWIKMFNLEFEFLGMVFGFTKGGSLMLTLRGGEMVFYNPKTEETSSLGTFAAKYSVFADAYTESLALLIEGEQVLAGVQNVTESESDKGEEDDDNDNVLASETWNQSVMLQFLAAIFNQ